MRIPAVIALLIVWSMPAFASLAGLDPKDGAVLPTHVAKELLNQCSRGAPKDITGIWVPSAKQVRELESRLPAALEAVALQRGTGYGQPADFRRQYAGYVSGARKIIYVNAFPRGAAGVRDFDWRRQVMQVCDGGPSFFGVEYDPRKKTFSHFEFNGVR